MPDSVAQLLDTVLAAEVTKKNYAERAQVDRPGESGAHDRPAAKRGFRLATWRVLVPVGAAAVLLAAGGYGLSLIGHGLGSQSASSAAGSTSSSSAAAGSAAKAAAAPSYPAPSAHPQLKSGHQPVYVSPLTLRQHVEAELRLARASRPTKAASPQVLGCIQLLAGSAPLELVESVRFEGHPATIIVARESTGYRAWVAGPNCSATTREVLDTITLPSGISGP